MQSHTPHSSTPHPHHADVIHFKPNSNVPGISLDLTGQITVISLILNDPVIINSEPFWILIC